MKLVIIGIILIILLLKWLGYAYTRGYVDGYFKLHEELNEFVEDNYSWENFLED